MKMKIISHSFIDSAQAPVSFGHKCAQQEKKIFPSEPLASASSLCLTLVTTTIIICLQINLNWYKLFVRDEGLEKCWEFQFWLKISWFKLSKPNNIFFKLASSAPDWKWCGAIWWGIVEVGDAMFYIAILSFTEQKSVKFYRNKSDVAWTLYIIWPNMMGVQ